MAVRDGGDAQRDEDRQGEQEEQADTADKAEFLGEGGEDEVGLLFRNKA